MYTCLHLFGTKRLWYQAGQKPRSTNGVQHVDNCILENLRVLGKGLQSQVPVNYKFSSTLGIQWKVDPEPKA